MKNRWYDNYPNLGKRLDAFKEMDPEIREPIIKGVLDLIEQFDPSLLSYETAFNFSFDFKRRRWYDNDPYLWVMFNTLKIAIADENLLQSVENYLEKEMEDNCSLEKESECYVGLKVS